MLGTVVLSVLAVGAAAGRLGATTAAARAQVWLREHQSPDEQGLQDLKNSDPNSYAIVQALLMKQQAGLLDPSNPAGKQPEEHESASDIMRSAPSIEGVPESISEVAISAPVKRAPAVYTHGNPWAFKPKEDDEAMVQNVLGAVSELKASTPSSSLLSSKRSSDASSALSSDMNLVGLVGSGSDLGAAAPRNQNFYGISMGWGEKAAPAAPVASMSQQNLHVSQASVATEENHVNPYLSTINFPGVKQASPAAVSKASDSLASFSWDEYADVASGRVKPPQPVHAEYIQQVDEKLVNFDQSKLKGALTDWLAPTAPKKKKALVQEEKQEEQSQPVDPMAIDNYNAWAHGGAFQ